MSEETQRKEMCEQHGEYVSKRHTKPNGELFWSGCPSCLRAQIEQETAKHNADLAAYNAGKRKELAIAETSSQRNDLDELLGCNYVPKRFDRITFDDLKTMDCLSQKLQELQKETYTRLKGYATNFEAHKDVGRCLTLFSEGFGSGKTQLALLIAKEIHAQGNEFAFLTMEDLLKSVKSTYSKDSKFNEQQIIKRLSNVDLLIIDDVKDCFGSQTEQNIMFNVLNGRYLNELPTIFTTNLIKNDADKSPTGYDAFRNCIGARSFDRIKQNNPAFISFFWRSYRK